MGKQTKSNMPLDESRLSFQIPRTDQPREKIVKLGRMITDQVPAKLGGVTGNDPEYWGLAGLVTVSNAPSTAGIPLEPVVPSEAIAAGASAKAVTAAASTPRCTFADSARSLKRAKIVFSCFIAFSPFLLLQ